MTAKNKRFDRALANRLRQIERLKAARAGTPRPGVRVALPGASSALAKSQAAPPSRPGALTPADFLRREAQQPPEAEHDGPASFDALAREVWAARDGQAAEPAERSFDQLSAKFWRDQQQV
jgi:hypothetical protein